MENLSEILRQFGISASNISYEPILSGHINNTFKVYSDDSVYILQKVNTDVFQAPEKIMHNIDIAQKAMKAALQKNGHSLRRFPEYLKANGRNYCICGGFWRMYPYIQSTDILPDVSSVHEFGKLLGRFHECTCNVPMSDIYITMPDFHNIEKNILKVLMLDGISYEQSGFYKVFLTTFSNLKNQFSPARLVHNDVKWANALVDPETLMPDTLIDLDTVMPGLAAFDFGDAVRSSCTTKNNELDTGLLASFSEGYFGQYRNININEAAAGILSVSAELSARYLYDVLTDGCYFSGLSKDEKMDKHNNNLYLARFAMDNLNNIKECIAESIKL